MVETGHTAIRRVRFLPPVPSVGDIEVNTLQGIRDRGGPEEFLTSQRLDFDLLVHIESGTTRHTVDFTDHSLATGDVLWVRAGQVHQWGTIADIEGPVVMFGPHAVDDRTGGLIRSHLVRPRSHWPAAELEGTSVPRALDLLTSGSTEPPAADRNELRRAALAHSLAAVLIHLALIEPVGSGPAFGPTHEAYTWFRDHIEEHFRSWHKVNQYAERLGYSARTLNRLARQHTGRSAKELIDERVVLEAKRLLSHADASVAEIAGQLGFDDASNFSSYFRRQAGMTPGAFRDRSRGRPADRTRN